MAGLILTRVIEVAAPLVWTHVRIVGLRLAKTVTDEDTDDWPIAFAHGDVTAVVLPRSNGLSFTLKVMLMGRETPNGNLNVP